MRDTGCCKVFLILRIGRGVKIVATEVFWHAKCALSESKIELLDI